MLVLTRKIGERIIIGDNSEMTVTVLEINDNQVSIGIDAPRSIPINREEVWHKIQAKLQPIESFS